MADVAPLLARLPILADRLDSLPRAELRSLLDAMQLDVVYQPADSALDVAATLYDLAGETAQSAARESAALRISAGSPAARGSPRDEQRCSRLVV
ncbi:MAG: hypothetical protein ACYDD6_07530 [Acidimicrobiales bacterium]